MKNPLKTERSTAIGLLLARLPLGVYFVIAGCNKLVADGSFRGFARENMALLPGWVSPEFGKYYLASLPFAEVLVGLMLVLGLVGRLGGLLGSLMIGSFIIAKTGVRNGSLPHPNLVFLGVALMLLFAGAGQISLDTLFWGKKKGD